MYAMADCSATPTAQDRRKLLIASGSRIERDLVATAVRATYEVDFVEDGWSCLSRMEGTSYELLVINAKLHGLSGEEVVSSLNRSGTRTCRVIMIVDRIDEASKKLKLKKMVDDVLVRPVNPAILIGSVMDTGGAIAEKAWDLLPVKPRSVLRASKRLFDHAAANRGELAEDDVTLARRTSSAIVAAAQSGLVSDILGAVSRHDNYTFGHNVRVASLLASFSVAVGIGKDDAELLTMAGILHDVGKMRTPLEVLHKPGRLDEHEWEVMKMHVVHSREILTRAPNVRDEIVKVSERHHERLDGTGYPHGLKGAQIDDLSLITAVADVFSALTDRRPYKLEVTHDRAFAIMRDMADSHLERPFVETFIQVVRGLDLQEHAVAAEEGGRAQALHQGEIRT